MGAPVYQTAYDLRTVCRGDTIDSWRVRVRRAGEPVELSAAVLKIRARNGNLVLNWPLSVVGNAITMLPVSGDVTADFPVGTHTYDLEITDTNGRKRTYLAGTITVVADKTY